MARRHKALISLTHDHHHALAQAQRLRRAGSADAASIRRTADDFVNFYLGRIRHHFQEEEEVFFAPVVDDEVIGPLIALALADHLRVHAKVRTLRWQLSKGDVDAALLEAIGDSLEAHVRFEEQKLFPQIEEGLSDEELSDLETTARRDL